MKDPFTVELARLLHETSPDCRNIPVEPAEQGVHQGADYNWAVVFQMMLAAHDIAVGRGPFHMDCDSSLQMAEAYYKALEKHLEMHGCAHDHAEIANDPMVGSEAA